MVEFGSGFRANNPLGGPLRTKYPVYSQLAGNLGSETSSLKTTSSSSESFANPTSSPSPRQSFENGGVVTIDCSRSTAQRRRRNGQCCLSAAARILKSPTQPISGNTAAL